MKGLFLVMATILLINTSFAGTVGETMVDCADILDGSHVSTINTAPASTVVTGAGGGQER